MTCTEKSQVSKSISAVKSRDVPRVHGESVVKSEDIKL